MRFAIRKLFFLTNLAKKDGYEFKYLFRFNSHLSPGTMENAIIATLTKKSDLVISLNLVLASERTRSRKIQSICLR